MIFDDAPIEWAKNDDGIFNVIERNVHIGYNRLSKLRDGYEYNSPVKIGKNIHIRSGTVIYAGCELGDNVHIGHNVVLREFTKIGDNSSIGSGVVCEGYTVIGHHTTIHAQTHLTAKMVIGNYVFIGPHVVTMNDKRIRYYRPEIKDSEDIGPIIGDEVAIGGGAIILPQVIIGKGSIIAAGSVVTKNVANYELWIGNPAKYYRDVRPEEKVKI
jgi:acetyltransferase-like isoleucine patch superfamily enzyme